MVTEMLPWVYDIRCRDVGPQKLLRASYSFIFALLLSVQITCADPTLIAEGRRDQLGGPVSMEIDGHYIIERDSIGEVIRFLPLEIFNASTISYSVYNNTKCKYYSMDSYLYELRAPAYTKSPFFCDASLRISVDEADLILAPPEACGPEFGAVLVQFPIMSEHELKRRLSYLDPSILTYRSNNLNSTIEQAAVSSLSIDLTKEHEELIGFVHPGNAAFIIRTNMGEEPALLDGLRRSHLFNRVELMPGPGCDGADTVDFFVEKAKFGKPFSPNKFSDAIMDVIKIAIGDHSKLSPPKFRKFPLSPYGMIELEARGRSEELLGREGEWVLIQFYIIVGESINNNPNFLDHLSLVIYADGIRTAKRGILSDGFPNEKWLSAPDLDEEGDLEYEAVVHLSCGLRQSPFVVPNELNQIISDNPC